MQTQNQQQPQQNQQRNYDLADLEHHAGTNQYHRIPYGYERPGFIESVRQDDQELEEQGVLFDIRDLYDDRLGTDLCYGCGAAKGNYHKERCHLEQCPRCGGQMRYCGCSKKTLYGEDDQYPPISHWHPLRWMFRALLPHTFDSIDNHLKANPKTTWGEFQRLMITIQRIGDN